MPSLPHVVEVLRSQILLLFLLLFLLLCDAVRGFTGQDGPGTMTRETPARGHDPVFNVTG